MAVELTCRACGQPFTPTKGGRGEGAGALPLLLGGVPERSAPMNAIQTTPDLAFRDVVIEGLRKSLVEGEHGLKGVPALTKRVISEGLWRERIVRATGEIVRFDSFAQFVHALPPQGLGADVAMLQRLCEGHEDILGLIDQEIQRPAGGANNPYGRAGKPYEVEINVDNINVDSTNQRPDGTSRQAALRRLRKDRPDLLERVTGGELSPHAAMLEAGFRRKTISVPLDPELAAHALARHFTDDQIDALIAALRGG
jgi:hypothetical protein